jgi:hypothetical protein
LFFIEIRVKYRSVSRDVHLVMQCEITVYEYNEAQM